MASFSISLIWEDLRFYSKKEMLSAESSSQSGNDSENCDYEIEFESDNNSTMPPSPSYNSEDNIAYAEEPLADSEWLLNYEKEVKAAADLEKKLKRRLDGTELVDTW